MNLALTKLLGRVYRDSGADDSGISGADVVGTGNDARIAMLNSIADNVDEVRASEMAHVNDDETTEPFIKQADTEDPPLVEKTETAQSTLPKIKVNGKEVELTEELVQKAQKIASGDEYLAHAAMLREDARKQSQPPAVNSGVDNNQVTEDDLAMARAIQMGTEEEAATILKKLRTPILSKDELTNTVLSQVEDKLSFNQAIDWFDDTYKDVVKDPKLKNLAVLMDVDMVKKGDMRPYKDRFKEIGDQLLGFVKVSEPVQDKVSDKQQRKEAAPTVPIIANDRSKKLADDEEKEESAQEIIAKMAASRGGAQFMR